MKKVLNIFGDIASISYFDDVVNATMVSGEVKDLTSSDELEININSYGGEVFEAVAISNIIANSQATKTFNILGICASAATMLFSANDKVNIFKNAMVMYHKPMAGVGGNAIDLRKTADLLDKLENETIIKNLLIRTKKQADEISNLLLNEWWLTSDEAVQNLGFIASESSAIENKAKTKQTSIYNNYIERKKALSNNAYHIFINYKNSLKR